MPPKSPEILKQEQPSPKEEKPLELAEEDESRAKSIEALKRMKELVGEGEKKEEKELPPERRLSPEEKEKIDEIIERVFKRELDAPELEKEIGPLGEKIVEPFLDKLESLDDSQLEGSYESFLLIDNLEGKVRERDAERLANLLLRDPIALDADRMRKDALVEMLGKIGTEKEIDKLVECSKKVIKTLYLEGPTRGSSCRDLRIMDQQAIQEALIDITDRKTAEEMDEEKSEKIFRKGEKARKFINKSIRELI